MGEAHRSDVAYPAPMRTCLKARRKKCISLWFFCLTPLCALRAAAPAGRPFGRVALLPSGFFASRRYARCARRLRRGGSGGAAPAGRLRRGGLSAGSRCSLMGQSVLLRHSLVLLDSLQLSSPDVGSLARLFLARFESNVSVERVKFCRAVLTVKMKQDDPLRTRGLITQQTYSRTTLVGVAPFAHYDLPIYLSFVGDQKWLAEFF